MDYDTGLFIDIIESIQGVTFLRSECIEEVHIRHYQGLKGNHVVIDTTDDFITNSTGKGHLRKLGLEYLVPSIFPD